jgi:hypothetical protein
MAAGIIFRQCILLLTQDRFVSVLGMFTFLLWPYLLGHALMNVKDIPFLCIWLACTHQLMRIFKIASTQKNFPMLGIAFLGALTGWLISIRVSGVLVFVQYFCFGLVLIAANWRTKPINFCLQTFIYCFSVLILVTGITLYILYPILWHNPLELINAINYMGSHPWQGNTLTAGEFIEPKTRLIYYLYSWLLIKLPIAAILGLLVLPIAVYLIKRKGDISFRQWMTFGLLFSTAIILCVLIGRRVALYNELRQILFLFPLLLMVSIVSLFFLSRQLVLCILLASNIFMLIDDLNLHPYQYSYINEVRRHSQLGKSYETDYFGLSIAETARWLNQSKIDGTAQCLYVPSPHQWRYYLDPKKFPCLDGYPGDLSLIKTPFLFFVQPRGSARYPAPPWCALRYEEVRKPFSSNITQRMGELYACRP